MERHGDSPSIGKGHVQIAAAGGFAAGKMGKWGVRLFDSARGYARGAQQSKVLGQGGWGRSRWWDLDGGKGKASIWRGDGWMLGSALSGG